MSEHSTEQDLIAIRQAKVEQLRQRGIDPYPGSTGRTHTNREILDSFDQLEQSKATVIAVGRIRSWRSHGGSVFAHIEDGGAKIQIYIKKDLVGIESFDTLALYDLGDFIEVEGTLFVTHKGEKTILVSRHRMLSKAIAQLPSEWYGLKDIEARYRKRYLDFALNPEVRQKITARATIMHTIRTFLVDRGFIEIENPTLEISASGAMARPFVTHINAYDMDLFLRISLELWQKKSLVGQFERVFDMGRAFRNEGVDFEHNPEFTLLEYYWAYASLEDNMRMHEELFSLLATKLYGKQTFEHAGTIIDFTPPYPRKTFREAILEGTGIDINQYNTVAELRPVLERLHIEYVPKLSHSKLLDELFKNTVRAKIIRPTFITQYPIGLKPLAKAVKDDPRYSDVFQLLIAGMEVSNSYNELNDPADQKKRFLEQAQMAADGDEEAMQIDESYIEAMSYGMPPCTGTGIGIDRLTAILTDSHHLREIIAYPLMKPETRHTGESVATKTWTEQEIQAQASLVIGKIINVSKHPNADSLLVCTVDIGKEQRTILTNCSNTREGLTVAVALPGTTILDWHGTGRTHRIDAADMRGIVSEGVMCAAEEIGIHVPETQREPLYEFGFFADSRDFSPERADQACCQGSSERQ